MQKFKTIIEKVNPKKPEKNKIKRAADLIKKGEIVAFPTETVYGLGADATNTLAIKKIFKAKGRPADNPLIVHIGDREDLKEVAENVPEYAKLLIKKFWPGPLTLVLKKSKKISYAATAGGETVGVRMPNSQIARALIRASGSPIAAPSANISTRPSSTTAEHVANDFEGKIPFIIDGGKSKIGVESTVVDCTGTKPVVLRFGAITKLDILKITGTMPEDAVNEKRKNSVPKSPGQKYKHYAPKTRMTLVTGKTQAIRAKKIKKAIKEFKIKNKSVCVITTLANKNIFVDADAVILLGLESNLKEIAKNLFGSFRAADTFNLNEIICEGISGSGIAEAIMDRIFRAADSVI